MDVGFDHMTVVVEDLVAAEHFFALLGFEETSRTVVSGQEMSAYMGISDWKADHVTLALVGAPIHQEVQLLHFYAPQAEVDAGAGTLGRTGFNHICFRVGDLDATLATLTAAGVRQRSGIMEFLDRRLVLLDGPGVVVELAEWLTTSR